MGGHDFSFGWKQFYFELERSCTIKRVVNEGGLLDHVSGKIKRSFHNSRKIKWAFHASRKKGERISFHNSYIWKNYVLSKALFVFFIIRLLRVLRDAKRKPSSEFYISHFVQPCKLVVLVNDLGHPRSRSSTRVNALPPLGSK